VIPTRRRRLAAVGSLVVVAVLVAACTAAPNTAAGHGSDDAGFLLGLWHGIIAPITFIVSLFNRSVGIYEVHNSGGWYNFGFLLGLSIIFSGSGAGARGGSRSARRSR
jgi:predicted small secreted protein